MMLLRIDGNLLLLTLVRNTGKFLTPRRYILPILVCFTCTLESRRLRTGRNYRREERPKMDPFLLEYLPILLFLGIAIAISAIMVFVPMLIAPSAPDPEKLSAYECGFEAFEDARQKFNVRFYLVSILFIVFDLEIAFFFPYAITLAENGLFGFLSITFFIVILAVGLLYEYKQGALEWE